MSYSFQRKECEFCKRITFHRRPDTSPVLLCTSCQVSALAEYDKQAQRTRILIELAKDSVTRFPSWDAVTVGRN